MEKLWFIISIPINTLWCGVAQGHQRVCEHGSLVPCCAVAGSAGLLLLWLGTLLFHK